MAKILLVEDDNALADSLVESLSFEGHTVERVDDGKDALDRMRAVQFDLVILDWQLPGKTGIDVCIEYRKQGGQSPVIMLTGMTTVDDKERGLDSGADCGQKRRGG